MVLRSASDGFRSGRVLGPAKCSACGSVSAPKRLGEDGKLLCRRCPTTAEVVGGWLVSRLKLNVWERGL